MSEGKITLQSNIGLTEEELETLCSSFEKLSKSSEVAEILKKAREFHPDIKLEIQSVKSLKDATESPIEAASHYIDAPFAARWTKATC